MIGKFQSVCSGTRCRLLPPCRTTVNAPAVAAVTAFSILRSSVRITAQLFVANTTTAICLPVRLCWNAIFWSQVTNTAMPAASAASINSRSIGRPTPSGMPSAHRDEQEFCKLRSARSGQAGPACVNRANRKIERTRSTGTPSKISLAISSAENPPFAFWITACTGTRVPLITHCPDTLPGARSTSGDFDHSIEADPSFAACVGRMSAA